MGWVRIAGQLGRTWSPWPPSGPASPQSPCFESLPPPLPDPLVLAPRQAGVWRGLCESCTRVASLKASAFQRLNEGAARPLQHCLGLLQGPCILGAALLSVPHLGVFRQAYSENILELQSGPAGRPVQILRADARGTVCVHCVPSVHVCSCVSVCHLCLPAVCPRVFTVCARVPAVCVPTWCVSVCPMCMHRCGSTCVSVCGICTTYVLMPMFVSQCLHMCMSVCAHMHVHTCVPVAGEGTSVSSSGKADSAECPRVVV